MAFNPHERTEQYIRNRQSRADLVAWLLETRWTYQGTIPVCPGAPLSLIQEQALTRAWYSGFCRSIAGNGWYRTPKETWPQIHSFFEGGPKSGALHAHMLIWLPDYLQPLFEEVADDVWGSLYHNQTCDRRLHLQAIGPSGDDQRAAIQYATKNAAAPENWVAWMILPQ